MNDHPLSADLPFIPAAGTVPLAPAGRALLATAHELGRTRFAPRAAYWDEHATFPTANYRDLAEAGFLALCIPAAEGGLGADFRTYCLVSAELARFCGATALTLNMHVSSTLWTGILADAVDLSASERAQHQERRRLHVERVVHGKKLYAQPFSEGTAAAAGRAPFGTTARKVDGGWLINGRKIWASLSGAADYYGVLCTEERGDGAPLDVRDTLYLAIPATAEGVAVSGDWNPMGMRGTVSRNLTFKDVFVTDAEELMPRGVYHRAVQTWPAMFFTLAPTYMGIGAAAYDFTVRYLRGEIEGEPPVKRRQYPTKQLAVAQMRITLESMRSLFVRALDEAHAHPSKDERMRLYAAHYTVMEGANELARLAVRTCGGQSIMRHLPLERLYRDSRCGALMLPWTAELVQDRLGRECLYEPGERD